MELVRVPDRFELLREDINDFPRFIVRVEDAIEQISSIARKMKTASRGSFLVFRGRPGSGKTTFLNTIPIFVEDAEVVNVPSSQKIENALSKLKSTEKSIRILVLQDREADLSEFAKQQLAAQLHSINGFIRSPAGQNTIVVWPVNGAAVQERICHEGAQIGGSALINNVSKSWYFSGPAKEQFLHIATSTVSTLNNGASISDIGISEAELNNIIEHADTIGDMLTELSEKASEHLDAAAALVEKEKFKLWFIVAAGNEPDGEVAGLTRGSFSAFDTDKAVNSTKANIVKEIQERPERIGVISTTLDARVFHLPALCALAIARGFYSPEFKKKMDSGGLNTNRDPADALARLKRTELANCLLGKGRQFVPKGKGFGDNTRLAFEKLAKIAENNDSLINAAIGQSIISAKLATGFNTEEPLNIATNRTSDLKLITPLGDIRVEVMWRKKTSRAEIANYILTKLDLYGKCMGI